MTDNSLSKIPYWDGKSESFGVYFSKIDAYVEFMGVGDALDPVLMANCPTKSEFAVLDVTNPTNGPLVELYKDNKKLCAIIALGQGKSHGIALLGKTKSDDFPNGLAHEFDAKAKKANKPSTNELWRMIGRTMPKKMRGTLAPSMLAASRSSFGTWLSII